ncbi:MAG: L,D-transpeptidase [Bacillota bacterium]
MPHSITLLCLLILLNQSGISNIPIPALLQVQPTAVETQTPFEMRVSFQTIVETQTAVETQAAVATPGEKPSEQPTFDYKEELKKMGFYKDETKDKKLNLRNAILRFQSSFNIEVSGVWSDKCQDIMSDCLATDIAVGEDHVRKPPTDGKWITINKTKRILTLYENNVVIRKYPVAIGNPPSLTPDGMFKVVNKIINPYWGGAGYAKPVKGGVPENPLGYRWLGLSYKDGRTLGIHGNNSPYSIGKNVSLGCIRMINSDVEQLFSIVPLSTPVWIGTDGKLKEWGVIQPEYSAAKKSSKAMETPAKEPGLPDGKTPPDEAPGAEADDEALTPKDGTVFPDFIDFPIHGIFSASLQSRNRPAE